MEEENVKKSNKKFIIGFSIFLIILISITVLATYFTIKFLDKDDKKENVSVKNNIVSTEEAKKEAEDKKYAIESYSETYNMNALKVVKYYDIDGQILTEYPYGSNVTSEIEFIQIYGLKDGSIQNKINSNLKNTSYSIGGKYVYAYVSANFSNVLSVSISNSDGKSIGLNYDLTTGEKIPFEKVFISSATINSYLADGLYRALAWSTLSFDENYNEENNMDNVDTSEYEDKFMMLINNYNKVKDNLNYTISASRVIVNGLVDDKILESEYDVSIEIDLTKYAKEVAIFKRYVTNESIFQDDSIGKKGIVVFTNYPEYADFIEVINYGKISDNIFVEEVLYKYGDEQGEYQKVVDYAKKLSEEELKELKNVTSGNNGLFFQRSFNIWYDNRNDYFVLSSYPHKTRCSVYYFQDQAFKDYINMKNRPTAGAEVLFFEDYMKEEYPNLEFLEREEKKYYFSYNGEYLGDNEEEAIRKIQEEQMRLQMPDENEIEDIPYDYEYNNVISNEISNTISNEIINNVINNVIVEENEVVNENSTINNITTNIINESIE